MPKKRQIPCLFSQPLASGATVWHWKPSKSLRAAGFVNVKLGTDMAAAFAQAMELNAQVAALRAGVPLAESAPRRQIPRIVRFAELIQRYKKSDSWIQPPARGGLAASTKAEYASRLRALEHWAMDGQLPVRDIDRQLVRDLRNELVKGSPWRAAGILRVLRLILQFAVDEGIVAANAAEKCDIPEPPARKTRMEEPVRAAIAEAARQLDMAWLALALELAFWELQRQGDIRNLNRMAWREMNDVDPRDAAVLANPRGRVMGFRLCQQKTGTWIDAPVPPFLHDEVESAMKASNSGYVFPHPDRAEEAMPAWMIQRRFREAQGAAWAVAIMEEDFALADAIDSCQFRDLRRTGMIHYKDARTRTQDITALSGHYALGKKTILDVYMPGDTAGACRCVANGVRYLQEREQREAMG
jgi:hypothetical protein